MAKKTKVKKLDKEVIKTKLWDMLCSIMHDDGSDDLDIDQRKRWSITSNADDGFSAILFGDPQMVTKTMKQVFCASFPLPPPEVVKLEVPMTKADKAKIIRNVKDSCLNKAAKDAILGALK